MSQQRTDFSIHIPAKAMLFGEYGVLFGSPALVATVPSKRFVLRVQSERQSLENRSSDSYQNASLIFESSFFTEPLCFDRSGEKIASAAISNSGESFVVRLVRFLMNHYADRYLSDQRVHVVIEESFSPALGLGSSSALIAGLVRCFELLFPVEDGFNDVRVGAMSHCSDLEGIWPVLIGALREAQGKGSGYDVAIQFMASVLDQLDDPELWIFQPMETTPRVTQVSAPWFWEHAGYLIPTGIAAPTGEILQRTSDSALAYGIAHANIAKEAIQIIYRPELWNSSQAEHPFAELLDKSYELATEQGIAPCLDHILASGIRSQDYALKTMGAGFGDSIWLIDRVLRSGWTKDFYSQKRNFDKEADELSKIALCAESRQSSKDINRILRVEDKI